MLRPSVSIRTALTPPPPAGHGRSSTACAGRAFGPCRSRCAAVPRRRRPSKAAGEYPVGSGTKRSAPPRRAPRRGARLDGPDRLVPARVRNADDGGLGHGRVACSTFSTLCGYTFPPAGTIMSLSRPVMYGYPPASRQPASPVRNQRECSAARRSPRLSRRAETCRTDRRGQHHKMGSAPQDQRKYDRTSWVGPLSGQVSGQHRNKASRSASPRG